MGAGSGGFLLCVRKENWNREEILAISTSVASSCPDLEVTLTEVDIVWFVWCSMKNHAEFWKVFVNQLD